MNPDPSHSDVSGELSIDNGNTFLINGRYESALMAYSKVIDNASDTAEATASSTDSELILKFRAFSHRAQVHLNLSNAEQALQDAESALTTFTEISDRKLLLDGEEEACKIRKEKAENTVKSLRAATKSTSDESGKFKSTSAKPIQESNFSTAAVLNTKPKPPTCPKYQYYQNENFMTISILEPNVTPDKLKVDFSLDKLNVVLEKSGIPFTVISGTLFNAVDVSKCKVKYTDEKVLIKLRKCEKFEWHNLFGKGAGKEEKIADASSETPNKVTASAATPESGDDSQTSTKLKPKRVGPYASHKDWDAIEKDLKEQEEKDKPEGEEAVNDLFQSIYKGADEDTKRAMIKSYQTSGGTCLSTNWNEVSDTDYEKKRQAPKGSEWRNWEGERLPQEDN